VRRSAGAADADTVADHCLSHKVGSAVYRAYQRGTKFAKRQVLLQEWADFLTGKSEAEAEGDGNVVRLKTKGAKAR